LNATFSKAYTFTRSTYDTTYAVFSPPITSTDEKGFIIPDGTGGFLYENTNEPAKLYGFQLWESNIEINTNARDQGQKVCGFASKYGFNLIKIGIQKPFVGATPAQIEENMVWYDDFFTECEARGVYIFVYFLPDEYLKNQFGQNLLLNGRSPVYFTDQSVIDAYKEYVTIVLNHQINGRPIKEDPAFILGTLMNEQTLVYGWRMGVVDGLDGGIYSGEMQELNPVYANKLKHHWNVWVRQKYPTLQSLQDAWLMKNTLPLTPFFTDDGQCDTNLKYQDEHICNLTIMNYSYTGEYAWRYPKYMNRSIDTAEFLVQTEEDFYTQMKDHVKETIGSKMMLVGGKPSWNPFHTLSASENALEVVDAHAYGDTVEHHGDSSSWTMRIGNLPLQQTFYNPNSLLGAVNRIMYVNKPIILGESNYVEFSEYNTDYLLYSIYGASGGWDGISRFIADFEPHPGSDDGRMRGWEIQWQAPSLALDPVATRLFVRGDITTSPDKLAINLKRTHTTNVSDGYGPTFVGWLDPGYWLTRPVGWGSLDAPADSVPNMPTIQTPYQTDNGQVTYDMIHRRIKIITPRTEGAYGDYDASSESLDVLSFSLIEPQGLPAYAVFLTSLDDQDISSSNTMLLTLVGTAQNSHMHWDTYHRSLMKTLDCGAGNEPSPIGCAPVYMTGVTADITLDLDKTVRVYPLSKLGTRSTSFLAFPSNGQVSFQVIPDYETPWYEIVPVSCSWPQYDTNCDGITTPELSPAIQDWLTGELPLQDFMSIMQSWKSHTGTIGGND
jgi:hypothetical protein